MTPRNRAHASRRAQLAVLSLLFAGLPSSALAAEATGRASGPRPIQLAAEAAAITGRIDLPDGVAASGFAAGTFHFDATDERWRLVTYVTPATDGTFEIAGLETGKEYRLALRSQVDGYVGGTYNGWGSALVGDPEEGPPVFAPMTDVTLRPLKSEDMSGTLSVPAGFAWGAGDLRITAEELGAEGIDYGPVPSKRVNQSSGGVFTIANVRPDGRFVLRVEDVAGGRFETGYYQAGVSGLVSDREQATAVVPDANVHITIGNAAVAPKLSVVEAPKVHGKAAVGEILTATSGTWSMDGLSLDYQWLRNGVAVSGEINYGYYLEAADAGAKISVRVTASKSGFASVSATSAPTTAVVKGAAPRATVAPAITGTARLGKTLRATAGTWDLADVKVSHQWLRAGKAIKGATSAKYTLKTADVGNRVSVRVTARLAGHPDGASSSSAKKVAKGKPKVTAKAKNLKAGERAKVVVRVKVAGLAKPAGTVIVKYGTKTIKAKLVAKRKGKVVVRLPKLKKGTYTIKVSYKPNTKSKKYVTKASSKKVKLRIR